jgi:hypothetical protein
MLMLMILQQMKEPKTNKLSEKMMIQDDLEVVLLLEWIPSPIYELQIMCIFFCLFVRERMRLYFRFVGLQ